MAPNFRINDYRSKDGIHLKLYRDFDGSSAHELLNLFKDKSDDTLKIYIHTDGLQHLDPFGIYTFFKILNGHADRIVFTGKKAIKFDLSSDHWSL